MQNGKQRIILTKVLRPHAKSLMPGRLLLAQWQSPPSAKALSTQAVEKTPQKVYPHARMHTCIHTYQTKPNLIISYHIIYHTIPYHTKPYHIPYHIPYIPHTIPHHTIPYTIPYHTTYTTYHIPYHTIRTYRHNPRARTSYTHSHINTLHIVCIHSVHYVA